LIALIIKAHPKMSSMLRC